MPSTDISVCALALSMPGADMKFLILRWSTRVQAAEQQLSAQLQEAVMLLNRRMADYESSRAATGGLVPQDPVAGVSVDDGDDVGDAPATTLSNRFEDGHISSASEPHTSVHARSRSLPSSASSQMARWRRPERSLHERPPGDECQAEVFGACRSSDDARLDVMPVRSELSVSSPTTTMQEPDACMAPDLGPGLIREDRRRSEAGVSECGSGSATRTEDGSVDAKMEEGGSAMSRESAAEGHDEQVWLDAIKGDEDAMSVGGSAAAASKKNQEVDQHDARYGLYSVRSRPQSHGCPGIG